jgi:hypothetical protein
MKVRRLIRWALGGYRVGCFLAGLALVILLVIFGPLALAIIFATPTNGDKAVLAGLGALYLVCVRACFREALGRRADNGHPCGQCGAPIEPPSRAEYCSPACRRYARLARAEAERRADQLEGFGGVPY